jgi:peptidase C80-like protein
MKRGHSRRSSLNPASLDAHGSNATRFAHPATADTAVNVSPALSTGAGLAWDPVSRAPGNAPWIGPGAPAAAPASSSTTSQQSVPSVQHAPSVQSTPSPQRAPSPLRAPSVNAPGNGLPRETSTDVATPRATSPVGGVVAETTGIAAAALKSASDPSAGTSPNASPATSLGGALGQAAQGAQALGSVLPGEAGSSVAQAAAALSTTAQVTSTVGSLSEPGSAASKLAQAAGAAQGLNQAASALTGGKSAEIGGAVAGAAGLGATALQAGSAVTSSGEAAAQEAATVAHAATPAAEGASRSAGEALTQTPNEGTLTAPHAASTATESEATPEAAAKPASTSANDASPTDATQRAIHQDSRSQQSGDQTSGRGDGDTSSTAAQETSSTHDSSSGATGESSTRGGATVSAISTAAAVAATAAVIGMGVSLEQTAAINAGRLGGSGRASPQPLTQGQGSSAQAPLSGNDSSQGQGSTSEQSTSQKDGATADPTPRDYKAEIEKEFSRVLYIRKTLRGEDELHYNVAPRAAYYASTNADQTGREGVEANYWHAASAVRSGVPIALYDSFSSTGLVLSGASTELGGFGKRDLGLPTKNVARDQYPSSFPDKAFPASNGKTLTTSDQVAAKLAEIGDRRDGKIPDLSTTGRPRGGTLMLEIDGDLYPTDGTKESYLEATSIPYNEAQVHYKPSDILGVYHDNTPDARAAAQAMKDQLLADHGLDLPFVSYGDGQIHVSNELHEPAATSGITDSPVAGEQTGTASSASSIAPTPTSSPALDAAALAASISPALAPAPPALVPASPTALATPLQMRDVSADLASTTSPATPPAMVSAPRSTGFVRVAARPMTPEQASSARSPLRSRFTSFLKKTMKSLSNLVKRGKKPSSSSTTSQIFLDPNKLLAAAPGSTAAGSTAPAWNTTHLQWHLDQATLLGATPTGNDAAATKKQLEMLALHSFYKAAQVDQVKADSRQTQITPFLNKPTTYHRSSGSPLLDKLHTAYEGKLGLESGTLHIVDNATFSSVLAREYPTWGTGPAAAPQTVAQFEEAVAGLLARVDAPQSTVTADPALLDVSALLADQLKGATPTAGAVNQLVAQLESAFLGQVTRYLAAQGTAAAALGQSHDAGAFLGKLASVLPGQQIAAFTEHLGSTLLITPKFLAGQGTTAPALQHVGSDADRSTFASLFTAANAAKEATLVRALDGTLIKTGYRVDPASAMEAWLAVEDAASILASENIPLSTLATRGGTGTIPTVHSTFQSFLDSATQTKFAALGSQPGLDQLPYVTVLTEGTAAALEGLRNSGVDTAFNDRGLQDVLQTSYFRIENAMREAMAFPKDFTRFLNQIELINQELSTFLEIARPYGDGDFQTGLLKHLGDTIPAGLSVQAELHPSALHSLASTLASVEALKGTNALQVMVLDNSYYESGMSLDHAKTYTLSHLDGVPVKGTQPLDSKLVQDLKAKGTKLDVFLGEFRHNISETLESYGVEDLAHQVDQLFENDLVSDQLTVVIDNTIDTLKSSNVKSFLEHNADRIAEGKLNVVVFRSAQKFDMLGLDNYYGGSSYSVNDPASFQAFNDRLGDPSDRLGGLNRQGLTHLVTHAAKSLDAYRGAIMDNTASLYSQLPADLKVTPGSSATPAPVQVSRIEGDDKQVFLAIKFNEISYKDTFVNALSEVIKKQSFAVDQRPSFGFAMSNLLTIFDKKMRFNPGLEGPSQIGAYAAFFAKWQSIISQGQAAGKTGNQIRAQLKNINDQRLVYALGSDPTVQANVDNLIGKKRPFSAAGPAKGSHTRASKGELSTLDGNDKLTIVGHGGAGTFGGKTAGELAAHLAQAGVTALGTLSLKGCDSAAFATELMNELKAQGITVGRITGRDGKVTITASGRTLVSKDPSEDASWMHQAPGTKTELTRDEDGNAVEKDVHAADTDAAAIEARSAGLRGGRNAGALPTASGSTPGPHESAAPAPGIILEQGGQLIAQNSHQSGDTFGVGLSLLLDPKAQLLFLTSPEDQGWQEKLTFYHGLGIDRSRIHALVVNKKGGKTLDAPTRQLLGSLSTVRDWTNEGTRELEPNQVYKWVVNPGLFVKDAKKITAKENENKALLKSWYGTLGLSAATGVNWPSVVDVGASTRTVAKEVGRPGQLAGALQTIWNAVDSSWESEEEDPAASLARKFVDSIAGEKPPGGVILLWVRGLSATERKTLTERLSPEQRRELAALKEAGKSADQFFWTLNALKRNPHHLMTPQLFETIHYVAERMGFHVIPIGDELSFSEYAAVSRGSEKPGSHQPKDDNTNLIEFWKGGDNEDSFGGDDRRLRQLRLLAHLFRGFTDKNVPMVQIGLRSGEMEKAAYLGTPTIYFEETGSETGARMLPVTVGGSFAKQGEPSDTQEWWTRANALLDLRSGLVASTRALNEARQLAESMKEGTGKAFKTKLAAELADRVFAQKLELETLRGARDRFAAEQLDTFLHAVTDRSALQDPAGEAAGEDAGENSQEALQGYPLFFRVLTRHLVGLHAAESAAEVDEVKAWLKSTFEKNAPESNPGKHVLAGTLREEEIDLLFNILGVVQQQFDTYKRDFLPPAPRNDDAAPPDGEEKGQESADG